MLFKTTEELKKYILVNAEFEVDALAPFIEHRAEPEMIIPHISQALFNKLQSSYESGGYLQDPVMEKLLHQVRYPLANYAFANYLIHSQTKKTKSGTFIESTTERKTAFQWQINDERSDLLEASYQGIERLLLFLEENKTDYPEWVASPGFTQNRSLFISSASRFNEIYLIQNSRRLYTALKGIMVEMENFKIKTIISPELFTSIKSQILAGTLTTNNAKLIPFIEQALAHLTIAKACLQLPIKFSVNGIHLLATSANDNSVYLSVPDQERITLLSNTCNETGENYLQQLNEYLYANAANYPLFTASSTYINPSTQINWDQSENNIICL